MVYLMIAVFVIAYAAIALEEPLKVNKSAAGLVGAGALWTIYALSGPGPEHVGEELAESLNSTAQIAFFLMGAMTIVEIIDSHDGFDVLTSRIRARTLGGFIWVMCGATFFLSAVLDNLTTTIVMISLSRKLLASREERLLLAGLIVISANAGGAWSPIGDVTTTMLWIGGQVTSTAIVTGVFLPSLVNTIVPLAIVTLGLRGRKLVGPAPDPDEQACSTPLFERNVMFGLGLACLLAVPVFKGVTHLPPFLGILFGLGILWTVGDILHRGRRHEEHDRLSIAEALTRIDMGAIVFFIGILLSVATLEHAGILAALAQWLDASIGRIDLIVAIIGLVSSVIDNVPMVAAAMGMYTMDAHPPDSFLWEFMAYCAGTGGSILIIGSAAGVAAMGIERIDFLWYLRRISLLALIGYVAGAITYVAQQAVLA